MSNSTSHHDQIGAKMQIMKLDFTTCRPIENREFRSKKPLVETDVIDQWDIVVNRLVY